MVAVVLGTALTALNTAPGLATESPEVSSKAVNDMSRYCTTCWRNARLHPDNWTDCTQEVFARLLERVAPHAWDQVLSAEGDERREFMRAIDAVKKRSQRSRKWTSNTIETVADRRGVQERRFTNELDAVRQAARELLSARQQRILQMSFEGWSVKDIAEELQTPAERISDEKYKAVCKLREHLQRSEW